MSTTRQPLSKTVFPWLKANLGKHCLGVLSGQDRYALETAVQFAALWGNSDDRAGIAPAFKLIVEQMQPQARQLAFHAIAHALDWGHRFELWAQAGLPAFERVWVCAYGPGGKGDAQ